MTKMSFIHALASLHAGTGQGVGVIDLPVAREKATGIPYLPGSSLKGVLRSLTADEEARKGIFGPDTAHADEHAGAAQFSDQRLLLLPVRSLMGTFAWITSPLILRRLLRDAHAAGVTDVPETVPVPNGIDKCLTATDRNDLAVEGRIILEDLDLAPEQDDGASAWSNWLQPRLFGEDDGWREILDRRICVVHEDIMNFLCETGTEVTARIRMDDETGTVARGGLWYEESLPSETVLYGLVAATPVQKTGISREEVFQHIRRCIENPVQLGGHGNVGRGLCRIHIPE